mgnify:FL=1
MNMKNKKSVICRVRDREQPISDHIAEITKQRYVPKPYYYRHRKTGEEYYTIGGALAWPSVGLPGFAVIVAVLKDDPKKPTFKVLEEIEGSELKALVNTCIQARYKWGYPNQYLLDLWFGDYVRFSTSLSDFNEAYERENSDTGLYLSPPNDFEQPNRTEIFLERVRSLLKPDEVGKKQLIIGPCEKLRSQLQNLPADAGKLIIEHFPAIAAISYVIHSLTANRPWLQFLEPDYKMPTIVDPWFEELYGNDDAYESSDDGWDDLVFYNDPS